MSATGQTTSFGSTATRSARASSARGATSGSRSAAGSSTRIGGGRINTDFIDNSGGVDCSDHEVNLKILLDLAVARGELTMDERNELLEACAPDVVQHVLYDNYLQAQILSQELDFSRHADRVPTRI